MRNIKSIKYIQNENARNLYKAKTSIDFINKGEIEKVRKFHKSFSDYTSNSPSQFK